MVRGRLTPGFRSGGALCKISVGNTALINRLGELTSDAR